MKFLSRYWWVATALSVSVFAESMAYTYMQEEGSTYYYSSSLIYLFAGIAICILPLLSRGKENIGLKPNHWVQKFFPYLFYILLIAFFIYHVVFLADLYKRWGVTTRWADMIPTIQGACRHLLHGIYVYKPLYEISPNSIIPYLPMMWLPFLPSVIFGYDPRWTTVGAVFLALFLAASPLLKSGKRIPVIPLCIAGISLFLALNYFLNKCEGFWTMTEEGVVAGFYLFLGYAVLRNNFYMIGFAIACCLLSRYVLIPWIPVYLGYIFFTQPRGNFFKLFFTFCLSITVIFIIPFFIWDPLYFLNLPMRNAGGFKWFWEGFHLTNNTFYSVGLYKFYTINTAWHMVWAQLATSFLLPVFFIIVALKLNQRLQLNSRFIGYGSLKLALVFFYNFFPIPYIYLFFPPTFISYVVLFDFLALQPSQREDKMLAEKELFHKPVV